MYKRITTATPPVTSASAIGAKWQRFNAWPQSGPPSSKLDLIPFGKYKGGTRICKADPYIADISKLVAENPLLQVVIVAAGATPPHES